MIGFDLIKILFILTLITVSPFTNGLLSQVTTNGGSFKSFRWFESLFGVFISLVELVQLRVFVLELIGINCF